MGNDDGIVLKAFREDPKKNPLPTPSGKIEIYSERLAKIASEWELPKGDVISALPKFCRTWEMPGDPLQKKYPLQCFGYHGHGRTHSTFHNLPWLREVHPDQVLINELDAKARNIADGDKVHVFNDRGCIEVPAHVTKRIIRLTWVRASTRSRAIVRVRSPRAIRSIPTLWKSARPNPGAQT